MNELLAETADRAAKYLAGLADRPVAPSPAAVARVVALGGPLPESPRDPKEVLALLDDVGSPATTASAGGRYFGFVIGGSLPASLAANWLAGAWDQNAAMQVMSPVAAKLGRHCARVDDRPARFAWRIGSRFRDRHHHGELLRGGRGPVCTVATRWVECGRRRIVRSSTHSRGGGRGSARVVVEGVIPCLGWAVRASREFRWMGKAACSRMHCRRSTIAPWCACRPAT